MKIDLSRFLATFFEEAAEHIERLETGLLELEAEGANAELLHAIFRAAHSIKGGAGSFGLAEVARFTHAMESLLDRLRDGSIAVTSDLTALLFRGVDTLKDLVAASNGGDPTSVAVDAVFAEMEAALRDGDVAGGQAADAGSLAGWRVRFEPNRMFFRGGHDPLLLLRELAELGHVHRVDADTSSLPPLHSMEPEECYVRWETTIATKQGETGLREVFLFVEDECDLAIERLESPQAPASAPPGRRHGDRRQRDRRAGGRPAETTSIRVPTDRVDGLINLVGELVIAQSMVNQVAAQLDDGVAAGLLEALSGVERNTKELQEQVLAVRMLPIGNVFSRFPRMVHDLALELDKDIRLETTGGETELDKGVIEKLSDPLIHLIRNAIDHGIEAPDERLAAGKPAQGVLSLSASHEGGNVVIELGDDGRGLDPQRIREKAIANGLISEQDHLTRDQMTHLIFQPGFSTAGAISDLSGRGVGMDVVKRNVEALKGSITVQTEPGSGTKFRVRLPMTLAILDGLSVRVGGQVFVIPLLSIVESSRPGPDDIRHLFGRGEMIVIRGDPLPFVRLDRLFAIEGAVTDPSLGIVVILEVDATRIGVLVDDVLGQSQVVVKNLETNFRKVDAVMGATILGNGEVSLILDVQELCRLGTRPPADAGGELMAAVSTCDLSVENTKGAR